MFFATLATNNNIMVYCLRETRKVSSNPIGTKYKSPREVFGGIFYILKGGDKDDFLLQISKAYKKTQSYY